MVVVLYLGGGKRIVKPQGFAHEFPAEGFPVYIGEGHMVGIEISGGTAEFGCRRDSVQQV